MDTAKDQSGNVLDDDLNRPAGKGVLSSGKFLSRLAGSEGDQKRREGVIRKL